MNWFNPKALLGRFVIICLLLTSAVIAMDFILIMMLRYWYVVLMTLVVSAGVWALIRLIRRRADRW